MKKIFIFMVIALLVMSSMISHHVVLAADLTNSIVKDVTIEKTDGSSQNFTHREKAKITTTFDATGLKIEKGDTISIALPEELKGFGSDISLKTSEGVNLGDCKVTTTHITCDFNENVNNLTNIKGSIYFTAEVNYVNEGVNDVPLNFGNTSISKIITVENKVSGDVDQSDEIFFKSGGIQADTPDVINWAIRFNNKQDYFWDSYPAVITDQLGEGQAYDLSSFGFSVKIEDQERNYVSIDEFKQQFGDVIINDKDFKVTLNSPNYTELIIYYDAKITDKTLTTFLNDSNAQFTDKSGTPMNESYLAEVFNIDSGGDIDGELVKYKGSLVINKIGVDSKGNRVPLKGAKFSLINNQGVTIDTKTSDDQGQIKFEDIQGGTHTLIETEVPQGYEVDLSQFPTKIVLDFRETKLITQEIINKKIEEPPTEEPITEEPTTEEPTTEAPTTEAPTTEEPTTEEPTTEAPPTNEPPTNEPPTNEPPTNEPPTNEPSTEAPPTNEPPTNEPSTEAPPTNEPSTEAPTTEEPTTEAPTIEEPTTEAPTTEAPTTEEPTTEEPTTEAPTTEAPTTTEEPTTNEPSTDGSPTNEPSSEAPPTNEPPTNEPSTEAPPTNEPPTEKPTTKWPTTEATNVTPNVQQENKHKDSDDLPNTGEHNGILLNAVAGLFLIIGSVLLFRRKEHKNQ